jgi:hypothetical protein
MKPRISVEWRGNYRGWKCVGGAWAWGHTYRDAYLSWLNAMTFTPSWRDLYG